MNGGEQKQTTEQHCPLSMQLGGRLLEPNIALFRRVHGYHNRPAMEVSVGKCFGIGRIVASGGLRGREVVGDQVQRKPEPAERSSRMPNMRLLKVNNPKHPPVSQLGQHPPISPLLIPRRPCRSHRCRRSYQISSEPLWGPRCPVRYLTTILTAT